MAVNPFSMVRPISLQDSASFGSFTRTGIGSYTGKDGYLKLAGANEPRFNHDPVTKVALGLMIEAAATNYATFSDCRGASVGYTFPGGGVTDNGVDFTALGPDNMAGVRKLTVTVGSSNVRWGVSTGIATGLTHGGSVWVKTADGSTQTVVMDVNDAATTGTATINGTTWTRVSTTGANGTNAFRFMDLNLPVAAYHIYGAQIEDNVVTSWIPTGAAAATRGAETMGALMASEVPDGSMNFVVFPEDLTGANWSKTASVVSAESSSAPLTTNVFSLADALIGDATTALHFISQTIAVPTAFIGQSLTFSVYAKAGAHSGLLLRLGDGGATNRIDLAVDLSTGVFPANAFSNVVFGTALLSAAPTITAVPGAASWYRITFSCILPSISSVTLTMYEFQNVTQAVNRTTFLGDNGSGVFLWGMQLHLGVNPLAYAGGNGFTTTNGNDPYLWSGIQTYTAGQQVCRTVAGGIHNIYQKLTASGSSSTPPENDTTNWVLVGPMNKWKMFDAANETQTQALDEINFILKPGTLADTLVFDNVDADSLRVFIPGTSYDTTIATKVRACSNWYQYFFEPFVQKKSAVFTGLPLVTTNQINVTARKATSAVKIGTCVLGLNRAIGTTEPGATVGIIDYSTKTTDQFGNTSITKRAYSKRMTVSVIVENADVDAVQDLLAQYRSTPVAWLGAGTLFNSMTIIGFYRSFDIVIAYPTQSRCSLEIEGLT
jgi:hypothetical protein